MLVISRSVPAPPIVIPQEPDWYQNQTDLVNAALEDFSGVIWYGSLSANWASGFMRPTVISSRKVRFGYTGLNNCAIGLGNVSTLFSGRYLGQDANSIGWFPGDGNSVWWNNANQGVSIPVINMASQQSLGVAYDDATRQLWLWTGTSWYGSAGVVAGGPDSGLGGIVIAPAIYADPVVAGSSVSGAPPNRGWVVWDPDLAMPQCTQFSRYPG